ncbi:C-type lectin domain family 7 member A-like [Denticeps clupeoides]|uniref:C-type lectin domain family 7 member A-like n=1 Tax=Denticeps clupeoides TaxID=299321 RepID=UPI0010A31D7D|nr:C-type lectin domain family 7 member A-like [Denticeps clupeoides]
MFKKDSNRPRSDSVVEGLQKGCLLGWVFFKEKCYYVSTDTKNWENSRVDCEEMGGHLLNLDNKHKLKQSLESSVQSCVAVYYQPRYYRDCNSELRRVCESSPVK